MRTWLLLAILLLFVWSISRERFQDTIALKGPPYGDSDYPAIVGMMSSTLVGALETTTGATKPILPANASDADKSRYKQDLAAYQRKLIDGTISDIMGDFHTSVYQPATQPIKTRDVDTFLDSKATSGFISDHKTDVNALLVSYFVNQRTGAPNTPQTESQIASAGYAASTGYAATLADVGQSSTSPPTIDTHSGNTTGGSTTVLSSNSGTNKGNIWGPAFTGFGVNSDPGVSSGLRDYPTLLGPKPKASTMVEGAGIVRASQHETLGSSGVLPSSAGLGSDANSQYFGSSRVPGDKDLIPNPYREFTPSTGSSKTEPVPYLSDFSAFFR